MPKTPETAAALTKALQAGQLRPGDEVKWNDPDDGICSRTIRIQSMMWTGPDSIMLTDSDGDDIEVWITELE